MNFSYSYHYTKVEVFVDKDVREAEPDREGKRASWRNKKARDFMHFLIHKSTLLITEKCRFMDKRVREISRFFCCAAAPVPPLRLRARESTHCFIHKYLQLSTQEGHRVRA